MEVLKKIQTILAILSEYSNLIIVFLTGILSIFGIILTNKIKNKNKVSQINKDTNKIP